jgi:hypothetical protein
MATITAKCACGTVSGLACIDQNKLDRYVAGELVQTIWPNFSPDEREILIGWRTGVYQCEKCWDAISFLED